MKKLNYKSICAILVTLLVIVPIITIGIAAAYTETAEWTNENPHKNEDCAFSIAVVGDTQTLVEIDTTKGTNYLSSIYDWLVDNKDEKNMQYVLGLGDITQYDTDEEWIHAKAEITKLNGVVPYNLIRGGEPHDTKNQFNNYFANEAGYTANIAGYYEAGSVANTYSTFTYGENKYLIFSLDFAAVDDVLTWAGNVIESEQFKDYKVIITTHCYLYKDGNPCSQKTPSTAIPDKEQYTSDDKYNNGDEMWDKLISKHENIFLVLSGHFESNDIIASQVLGDNGNVITQMMIDPQGFDYKQGGETGMVCMLYFSADGSQVSVEWYSTYREQFYKPSNQFDIDLTTMSLGGGISTKYGYITARNYDPVNYPYALFKKTPSVGGDGTKYDYTFYGAYNSLVGDSTLGTPSSESALQYARDKVGDGAVILLLRDVVNTDTANYSNLQYHKGSLTIDLGGHTMVDQHSSSTALFFCHMKDSNNHMSLTVKNGTLLVGNKGLTQYDGFEGKTNSSITVNFENMTIGYTEGSTSSTLIKSYAADKEYSGLFPVNFNNCTIDMANAPDGAKIGSATTGETIMFTNSKIENSKLPYIINEYGCTTKAPGENEGIAVYKKLASNLKMDGVTYPSEYTFYGYYKALYADSALGVTTTTGAYHAARTITEQGNEAVIALLGDHEITTTANYSNLCYNVKSVVFDLRGYTLTDSKIHTDTTIFYMYVKERADANSVFTVKNGNMVLGSSAMTNYTAPAANYTLGLVFDNVNFSWKSEGTNAGAFLGTTTYRDTYPVTFNNCTIDLANAKSSMKLENGGTLDGITFNNTKILNSTDSKVYTADESDLLDGSYTFTKYGIIPLLAYENTRDYPFVAYKNSSVTVNGITYNYAYDNSYKVLAGDSAIGVTADTQLGISALRYGGDGVVLLMMRDYVYTATSNYTNLCYNPSNATFDLGGYTLTESQKHGTTGLFHNHLKYANQNAGLTVKNGNIVLSNSKGLISYDFWDAAATSKLSMVFENLNISFAKGSSTTYLVGKFTKAPGCYSVTFNNCTIDLTNVNATSFNIAAGGSCVDGIDLTITDTSFTNSDILTPKHNITLESDFVLNAYVPTSTLHSNYTIASIEFGGTTYALNTLPVVTIDGGRYYKVSVSVAPNTAYDMQTLKVNLEYNYTYSDGSVEKSNTSVCWSFSVLTYLEDTIGTEGATMDTLAKDILAYIRAVYAYENSANANEVKAFVDGIIGENYNESSVPANADEKLVIDGMKSAKVHLGSTPAFIFYPELDANGNPVYGLDKYVFALDGRYALTATVEVDENGYSFFRISLPAYAVNGTIEYIISGTDIHGYYNLEAYYNYFKNSTDTNLVTLIERLKKYGESALNYKNSLA